MGDWHELRVTRALVERGGVFDYGKQFVCVPNVTTFSAWEADLLVASKAGYLTEVEVKISKADWRADKGKTSKFNRLGQPGGRTKFFYYAAPAELARQWEEIGIPAWAGVIAVEARKAESRAQGYDHFSTVIRPACPRPEHRKLTDKEMANLARLGALRIWDLMTRNEALSTPAPQDRSKP